MQLSPRLLNLGAIFASLLSIQALFLDALRIDQDRS
jgi:hypothetical protein